MIIENIEFDATFPSSRLLTNGMRVRNCIAGGEYRRLASSGYEPINLYKVKIDTIFLGDYYFYFNEEKGKFELHKCKTQSEAHLCNTAFGVKENCFKIYETTNVNIKVTSISDMEVEEYCKFYNKNNYGLLV